MKVASITVLNYRSLKNAALPSCGSFNVLIGKNNAGKSTILAAINNFFKAVHRGDVVNLDTNLGKLRDFSDRRQDAQISITCEFHLTDGERQELLDNIIKERPQLKTAVESVPPNCLLVVEVRIWPPTKSFAYVRRMLLRPEGSAGDEKILLDVGEDAATALHTTAASIRETDAAIEFLRRLPKEMEEDDWQLFKARELEGRRYAGTPPFARRQPDHLNPAVVATVQASATSATTYGEFLGAIRDFEATYEAQKTKISSAQLAQPIKTFSGDERVVPGYALALLRQLGATKVLNLTEYRKQIGSEEAQKLLNLKTRRGGNETLKLIQTTVADLLGVRLDAFSAEDGPAVRTGTTVGAELDVDDYLAEMNGSGIREALRLVLDTTFERPQLLLVEEPEIHLHPSVRSPPPSRFRRRTRRARNRSNSSKTSAQPSSKPNATA